MLSRRENGYYIGMERHLQRFENEWIPKENAYLEEFAVFEDVI